MEKIQDRRQCFVFFSSNMYFYIALKLDRFSTSFRTMQALHLYPTVSNHKSSKIPFCLQTLWHLSAHKRRETRKIYISHINWSIWAIMITIKTYKIKNKQDRKEIYGKRRQRWLKGCNLDYAANKLLNLFCHQLTIRKIQIFQHGMYLLEYTNPK